MPRYGVIFACHFEAWPSGTTQPGGLDLFYLPTMSFPREVSIVLWLIPFPDFSNQVQDCTQCRIAEYFIPAAKSFIDMATCFGLVILCQDFMRKFGFLIPRLWRECGLLRCGCRRWSLLSVYGCCAKRKRNAFIFFWCHRLLISRVTITEVCILPLFICNSDGSLCRLRVSSG